MISDLDLEVKQFLVTYVQKGDKKLLLGVPYGLSRLNDCNVKPEDMDLGSVLFATKAPGHRTAPLLSLHCVLD